MPKIPYTHTNQEAFDIAYKGILAQGGPSYEETKCLYRSPNGRKCAAGLFIPDELYEPRFERLSLENIFYFPTEKSHHFVCRLQSCHDTSFQYANDYIYATPEEKDAYFLKSYKSKMKIMALEFNLTYPE